MADSADALQLRYDVCPEDAEAVRRLVDATGFFRPDETDVAVELVTEHLAKGSASGYHFVFADDQQRPLGYVCFGPIACTLGSFDIYWIVVGPDTQRRGLGRRLLKEAEHLIAQAGGRQAYIETSGRPQYEPTRQFYLRCGYETAAVLPDFYDTGDDKFILVKRIAPHQPV